MEELSSPSLEPKNREQEWAEQRAWLGPRDPQRRGRVTESTDTFERYQTEHPAPKTGWWKLVAEKAPILPALARMDSWNWSFAGSRSSLVAREDNGNPFRDPSSNPLKDPETGGSGGVGIAF